MDAADLFDEIAARLVEARPVVPPEYREKTLEEITTIQEPKRPSKHGTEIGLQDNRELGSVDVGTSNILSVYDQATPSELEFWSHWYRHASQDVRRLAEELGVPFPLMAAVVAITSPGNKWAMNLRAAERAVRLAETAMDDPERLEIEQTLQAIQARQKQITKELAEAKKDAKTDPGAKDRIADLNAESAELTQQTKDQTTRYGGLSKRLGQSINTYPANIRKAINVLQSEDPATWVTGPKVSAFLKAILDPSSVDEHMVLDGHAINLFDGVKQALQLAGAAEGARRARMLAAYEAAAKARQTNTRAVQAVTWYIFKSLMMRESSLDNQDIAQLRNAA